MFFVFLCFSIAKIKIQYANKIVSYKRYGPNYLQTRRDTWIPCSILLTSDSCFYPCFWPVLHRFCLYNRETNCMYFNYFYCKSKTTFGKVIKQKKKNHAAVSVSEIWLEGYNNWFVSLTLTGGLQTSHRKHTALIYTLRNSLLTVALKGVNHFFLFWNSSVKKLHFGNR